MDNYAHSGTQTTYAYKTTEQKRLSYILDQTLSLKEQLQKGSTEEMFVVHV